ncbi:MAG: WD40 repeat domain-containing protein [Anaerolineae bacterium]|nr:WD40 repeat domain-containing protein [Anaerolineae bacterium]
MCNRIRKEFLLIFILLGVLCGCQVTNSKEFPLVTNDIGNPVSPPNQNNQIVICSVSKSNEEILLHDSPFEFPSTDPMVSDSSDEGFQLIFRGDIGKGVIYDLESTIDGDQIAVSSPTGIWLYNQSFELQLSHLPGNFQKTDIDWSTNGEKMIIGEESGNIFIWQIGDKPFLQYIKSFPLVQVSWSFNERYIATLGKDDIIRIIDLKDQAYTIEISKCIDNTDVLSWSPGKNQLASGGASGFLHVWDGDSGEELMSLNGRSGPLTGLAWSSDGSRIATAGEDGSVRIWDVFSGEEIQSFEHEGSIIESIEWSPGDKEFAYSLGETIVVWEVEDWKKVRSIIVEDDYLLEIEFSNGGDYLISYGFDQLIRVFETTNMKKINEIAEYTGQINTLVWDPEGWEIASGGNDSNINIWELESGNLRLMLKDHITSIRSIAWSADGKYIASGGYDGTVIIWDAINGTNVQEWKMRGGSVFDIAWHPIERLLAISTSYGDIVIWEADNWREYRGFRGHDGNVETIAWAPGGEYLGSGGSDGVINLWDFEGILPTVSLSGHGPDPGQGLVPNRTVYSLAWHPEGNLLASGGVDGMVRIWDPLLSKQLEMLVSSQSWIMSVAWSPDGKYIASGGLDGYIRIWRTDDWKEVTAIYTRSAVYSIEWSPQIIIASGGEDGLLKLWELIIE